MNPSKVLLTVLLVSCTTTTIICEELPSLDDDIDVDPKTNIIASPKWLSHYWLIASALIGFQSGILFHFGQPIISRTGGLRFWSGDVQSRENSQHLTDWYTFTHVIHGIGYYWLLGLITPRSSMAMRSIIAIVLEVIWEVLENTPMIINRYRRTAVANGYSGDSIVNSISDTMAMSLGFYLSKTLPSPVVIAYSILSEAFCAYIIRDNLVLNLIQLIHPLKSISHWQANL